MPRYRATVAPLPWVCRHCATTLGHDTGGLFMADGGKVVATGAEWGEQWVLCQGCRRTYVWWPARVPKGVRGKIAAAGLDN